MQSTWTHRVGYRYDAGTASIPPAFFFMQARILIGISTYNEMENLPTLVEQIEQHLPQAEILVVDDASPDGTGEWCEQLAKKRTDVHCIRRSGKLGLGTATIATFRFAIENNFDFLINMDADLSHRPEYLLSLVNAAQTEGVDVAVGSRYVAGGNIIGWPLHRKLMSRCVNGFARLMLGLPTKDCSGSYRCYRVSKLRQLSLDRVRSQGYSFFEEILWHLRHAKAKFEEVPITFHDREFGKSKINLRETLNAAKTLMTLAVSRP